MRWTRKSEQDRVIRLFRAIDLPPVTSGRGQPAAESVAAAQLKFESTHTHKHTEYRQLPLAGWLAACPKPAEQILKPR